MSNITDNVILNAIAKDIEAKYDCKVLSIDFWQLISLCVRFKIQFNEDFLYRPFEDLPKPESICFPERSGTFIRRVDLFECVKNQTINNY